MNLKDVVFEVYIEKWCLGYVWSIDAKQLEICGVESILFNSSLIFNLRQGAIENAKSFFTENDLKFKILGE